ncbi:MAG: hypothetical protein OXC30_05275, partial [Alphaproteobacteria bacterium]|nr:hypothetical protein [Alphaproteobacteria bacterium]
MINIIIFSLFMCIFNTDAAEGFVWFTVESVVRKCGILQSNLAPYEITCANSVVLKVCDELSQPDFFQNETPVMQADIEIILHTLCQKSEIKSDELAHTFRYEGGKLSDRKVNALSAFGQCVPKFDDKDIEEILNCFPNRSERLGVTDGIAARYKKQGLKRFSSALKYAVWKIAPIDPDCQAGRIAWLEGESAKRHYVNLESNLANEHVNVEDSTMLQVCRALSQPDIYQQTD